MLYRYDEVMWRIEEWRAQAEADHLASLVETSFTTSLLNRLGLVLEHLGERFCALAGEREQDRTYFSSFTPAHQP